jgi:ABC-type Mn2+/Zn2+ transport system permease subunit
MVAWAAAFGSLSSYVGLLASYHFNTAAGSSIVLVAVGLFFIVFLWRGPRRAIPTLAEMPHA